jgi:hypothetical protein
VSRISIIATALAVVALSACSTGQGAETSSIDDRLRRDLNLAAATSLELVPSGAAKQANPLETTLLALPDPRVRQAAPAPSPARTRAPARSPRAVQRAPLDGDAEDTVVELAAVEPSEALAPAGGVALPRPASVSIETSSGGAVYEGVSRGPSTGEVIGVVLGTAAGIILRGGAVGIGDDDCERHRRGRRRPVYVARPGGLATTSRPVIIREPITRNR